MNTLQRSLEPNPNPYSAMLDYSSEGAYPSTNTSDTVNNGSIKVSETMILCSQDWERNTQLWDKINFIFPPSSKLLFWESLIHNYMSSNQTFQTGNFERTTANFTAVNKESHCIEIVLEFAADRSFRILGPHVQYARERSHQWPNRISRHLVSRTQISCFGYAIH